MTDAQPAWPPTHQDLPASVFASSFGAEAARYDQVRPSYPAAALDRVLGAPGRPAPRRILDVGAGTGKLTALLLDRGAEVVAVEPDEQMRAVLAERLPAVRALAGRAEDLPLPDGSVDAVLAGQAFHWFTRPQADREFARVLRPGGVAALVWNFADRDVEWVRKLYELTRQPELQGGDDRFDPLDLELFGAVEQAEVPFEHRLAGPAGLRDLVHTWSWVITRSAADRAAIDRRLRILTNSYPELQQPVVLLPQRTEVFWQRRL